MSFLNINDLKESQGVRNTEKYSQSASIINETCTIFNVSVFLKVSPLYYGLCTYGLTSEACLGFSFRPLLAAMHFNLQT